jgi:hypothetical protein
MRGIDTDGTFVLLPTVLCGLLQSRDAAVFEELLSDLGKAFIAGLLTGGAFVAMRRVAVGSVRQYLRAPWRQDSISAAIGGLVEEQSEMSS